MLDVAERMERGELEPGEYKKQLLKAQQRLTELFDRMAAQLEREGRHDEAYRDGVVEALADAIALFQYGLDELMQYQPGEDRAPIRLGRLLLEKGEQEYLALLDVLQGGTEDAERERTVNLWGHLRERADLSVQGQIPREEWLESLASAEYALRAHMEGTFRDFQRALLLLKHSPDHPGSAQQRALMSLHRLKEFLGLSV